MHALPEKRISKAFFISPITDMEQLILDMLKWAGVSEHELAEQGEIQTNFGETLSWEYLCYVRVQPLTWRTPTEILYGEKDELTSLATITEFAQHHNAGLTVMPGGEHWFHTEEQMQFLTEWVTKS